jgi:branched-chain amino acid transport system substrate-binding protein
MKKVVTFICIILILGYGCSNNKQKETKNETKETVKIGIITPLSGDVATYGDATKIGVDIAIEEMDSILKSNNLEIKLIYEDSKLEAKFSLNAFNKLVNIDKVKCILGPFGSSNVLAVASNANSSKIPIFSASATADDIKNAGEFVFRNVPSNNLQGLTLAKYIVKKGMYDLNKIGIYYLNNDYGLSLTQSFEEYISQNGGRIIIKESFETAQKNFRTTLQKIKEKEPSFIYIPDHYNEVGLILKQSKEIGLKVPFGGGDGSYSEDLLNISGSSSNGFILTLMGTDDSNSKLKAFSSKFSSQFKGKPDVYSIYAYDAMSMYLSIILELKRNGIIIDGKTIKEQLLKTKFDGATGITKFDKNGEVNKLFSIYVVENNEFKKLKK